MFCKQLQRRNFFFTLSLLSGIVLGINAEEIPTESQSGENVKSKLVLQLGAKSFAVREKAMYQLITMGLDVLDDVKQGSVHDDPEIRIRSRIILSSIQHLNRAKLIDDFLSVSKSDSKLKSWQELPGWQEFRRLDGDRPTSRNMYARMLACHWDFLQYVFSSSQGDLGSVTTELAIGLQNAAQRNRQISEEELATVLFAAGHPNVYLQSASSILSLCGNNETRGLILTSPNRDVLLKLMGVVVRRRYDDVSVSTQLYLAVLYGLPDGLSLARQIVGDRDERAYVRQNAIILIAKLGSKNDIRHLMPLLDDESQAIRIQNIQIRDMSLASMVHLAGDDPKDYGFDDIRYDTVWVFELYSLTLKNDQVREAGIKRWREKQARTNTADR